MLVRQLTHLVGIARGQGNAAANVLRVFQADEARDRVVDILAPDRGEDVFDRKCPILLIFYRTGLDAP